MNIHVTNLPAAADAVASGSAEFLRDVLAGLGARPKTLPAKYFYDLEGSRLFEEITHLAEYYPTRTELGILRERAREIGELVPGRSAMVEFGAGSTEKIRALLSGLTDVAAYVPVDVSGEFVLGEAEQFRAAYPDLEVHPLIGDFTSELVLPAATGGLPRVGFFPGSTIGNFEPDTARDLLRGFGRLLGAGALMVLGVDGIKDDAVLNAAYDDASGTTARFNLNLLARINRELGADFDLAAFDHRAFFDRDRSRIEMHLASREPQVVHVAGETIRFERGETIHTESSYKYTRASFSALAEGAGWRVTRSFTDADELFFVFVLTRA